MSWSWQDFVDRHRIDHDTTGPHTARNNIYVVCPFCQGESRKLLGLRLDAPYWGCWKSSSHRGKTPERLVAALLGVSYAQAAEEVKSGTPAMPLFELSAKLDALDEPPPAAEPIVTQKFQRGFVRIKPEGHEQSLRMQAYRYLQGRGFKIPKAMAKYYKLRVATRRDPDHNFYGRVIFPFLFDDRMVGWTGRAIDKRAKLRYRSFPEGKLPSRILFNFDKCKAGGRVLVLSEGPVDTINVDWHGAPDVRCAGLLGLHFDSNRVKLIEELMQGFDRLALMLDPEALSESLKLLGPLTHLDPQIVHVPEPYADPGDIPGHKIPGLFQHLC